MLIQLTSDKKQKETGLKGTVYIDEEVSPFTLFFRQFSIIFQGHFELLYTVKIEPGILFLCK